MSKLANKIRKITRVEPAPLGFGAAAARPRPPSLLLMVHGPALRHTTARQPDGFRPRRSPPLPQPGEGGGRGGPLGQDCR